MFQIGDFVVNAHNGICRIADRLMLDLSGSGQPKEYFLLIPIEEETAKVYIPADAASDRIRPVITEEQAWQIIRKIPDIAQTRVINEKEREKVYKDAVYSADPVQLVAILKLVHARRIARSAQGKKSTAMDDRYCKIAENSLFSELCFALGRPRADIPKLLQGDE